MSSVELYDTIGATYTSTRRTEPRIAAQLWAALGDAQTVLNVGAGTGSYEPPDRQVVAVEPSMLMRSQRPPNAAPCLLTSATKSLELAVSDSIKKISDGSAAPGDTLYDAKNDGIGVAVGHDNSNHWAPDAQTKINAALAGMKDGSLKTCPDKCGSLK